ncbi:2-dehydro-3-deoxy-6-phosphogalactonate aldolase [Citromicrobium bathyomarinum]|uniref:2-dehydro-3-deoxy-6-phosphogalactonate aldolase n=1 Tax=Citromicrobium bathyomarinum TaxID=72174 RepID=UPI00315A2878
MTHLTAFDHAFHQCPLVAILRGVKPDEVEEIGEVLVDHGIALIEVPLNSPQPFESIARLARRLSDRAVVGAGTVLTEADVAHVSDAGGQMVVSPNTDAGVIRATHKAGLVSLPGFVTPTEAFTALAAGATALKLFPAETSDPRVLSAIRAVLPADLRVLPVGGIDADTMAPWLAAGAAGFGLGSSLYKAGRTAQDVGQRAAAIVAALEQARSSHAQ